MHMRLLLIESPDSVILESRTLLSVKWQKGHFILNFSLFVFLARASRRFGRDSYYVFSIGRSEAPRLPGFFSFSIYLYLSLLINKGGCKTRPYILLVPSHQPLVPIITSSSRTRGYQDRLPIPAEYLPVL